VETSAAVPSPETGRTSSGHGARVTTRWLKGRRPRARRYLRSGLSLEELFDTLNQHGVRYVVLRWFETLPSVDAGEDIDILVADEDLEFVGTLLTRHVVPPRRQKFDVYTVSGLPGSERDGLPYFPRDLANAVLAGSSLRDGRYRVPSAQDHFDSLAYHVLYHKGVGVGLPETTADEPPRSGGDHDYAGVLARLAADLQLSVPITMQDLDSYLAGKGLRPALDTLDKLGEKNQWLHDHLHATLGPADAGIPGLAVFILRAKAAHLLEDLYEELRREGWEPLETVPLDPSTAARAADTVRGANWGRGPFPVAGGGPLAYVIAYDLSASADGHATEPARISRSKTAIRRRLMRSVPTHEHFNPLHSSDNPRQALEYLDLLGDTGLLDRLRARIDGIRATMEFPYPVIQLLPSGRRRALIAVVQHPVHGECVCKLFYPNAGRFLERELRARTEFAWLPEVPTLLESGPNWMLTHRLIDTRAHVRRQLPGVRRIQLTPTASLALARMVRDLHEHGVFLLDLSHFNLLSDREQGLKVLDWEFLQDFPDGLPELEESPTVLGRPQGLKGVDVPLGVSTHAGRTVTLFNPMVTGIPTRFLLGRPSRRLVPVMEVGLVGAWLARGLRTVARDARNTSRSTVKRAAKKVLRHLENRPVRPAESGA
jgi:hypothetical protein